MSLRGRGPAGSAARTAKVLARFGATASAMARRLDSYDAITRPLGIRPTWPTTASVLARHPELVRHQADRGAEIALHGLVHGDHKGLDPLRQHETIARAVGIFERFGFHPVGFRGPYLRYDQATEEALRDLGFRYHSSQAVVFPLAPDVTISSRAARSYALARGFYSALDAGRIAVTPRLRSGLVDMPVAIPDDEILTERLRVDEATAAAQWLGILEFTYRRGDLFTIQLHPERITELGEALGATCSDARGRRPSVYIARLDEIADWWLRRSRFSLVVRRTDAGRYRVHVEADGDATLLVRGLDVATAPWYGVDAICELRDFEVAASRIPVVGISVRSPAGVRQLLADEGLPFEISDQPGSYGAYVDAQPEWTEAAVLETIDRAPGPLLRLGRWPAGARSALAVTGDIDALTLQDFVLRSWETRGWSVAGAQRS